MLILALAWLGVTLVMLLNILWCLGHNNCFMNVILQLMQCLKLNKWNNNEIFKWIKKWMNEWTKCMELNLRRRENCCRSMIVSGWGQVNKQHFRCVHFLPSDLFHGWYYYNTKETIKSLFLIRLLFYISTAMFFLTFEKYFLILPRFWSLCIFTELE